MKNKFITPIILIAVAIGLFFVYINPTYKDVQTARAQQTQLADALDRSRQLQALRDDLLSQYNSFSTDNLERLARILPDNVDNVRLILELDNIASQYGMTLQSVSVEESGGEDETIAQAQSREYDTINVSFTVAAEYQDFLRFIHDLERNVRLVDLNSMQFAAESNVGVPTYDVSVTTYWLSDES